jgi:hypothetical protein
MTTCLCLPHRAGYEILSRYSTVQYPYPVILLLLSRSVFAQERTRQGKEHNLGLGQCICHPSYSLLPVRCPLQYSNQPPGHGGKRQDRGESKPFSVDQVFPYPYPYHKTVLGPLVFSGYGFGPGFVNAPRRLLIIYFTRDCYYK